MKYIAIAAFVCAIACTPGQRAVARSVLDAADFACVILSRSSNEDAVAKSCAINEAARPALREALAGKASAQRAGAVACTPEAPHGSMP